MIYNNESEREKPGRGWRGQGGLSAGRSTQKKKHKSTESGEVRFKIQHQQEGCRDLPRGWDPPAGIWVWQGAAVATADTAGTCWPSLEVMVRELELLASSCTQLSSPFIL